MTVLQEACTTLIDVDSDHVAELPIRVSVSPLGVSLYAEGYGDKTSENGHGSPVHIELRRGRLRLIVWADINRENSTHIIYLDGARED